MDNIKISITQTKMVELNGREVFDKGLWLKFDGWNGWGIEWEGGLLVFFPGVSNDGTFARHFKKS